MIEKKYQVALVLKDDFGEALFPLSACMPVWIIDSSDNRSIVETIRNSSEAGETITTFPKREPESLGVACERIMQSLDEHHNECSQTPGYKELVIIGVSLGDVSLKPFLELGFIHFLATTTGFIAKKIPVSCP